MNIKNEITRLAGLKGTVFILDYMNTHEKTRYKDLNVTLTTYTLNMRLKELLMLGLIKHHFVRKEKRGGKRKEWYEITEKGKKALEYIRKLQDIDTLH